MEIEYAVELPAYSPQFVDNLASVASVIFGQANREYIGWRISKMPNFSIFCALNGQQLIGFKAGYAMTRTKYYSWLGGVHPDFRRLGVASSLMQKQHAWLIDQGYSIVESAVNQGNHAMAQANLRDGFIVCGIRTEPHRTQILYSKTLR